MWRYETLLEFYRVFLQIIMLNILHVRNTYYISKIKKIAWKWNSRITRVEGMFNVIYS